MKVLITHTDLDGLGTIALCKYYAIHYDKIFFLDYDDLQNNKFDLDNLNECSVIDFVDFSPSSEALRTYIESHNITCTILDHHDTAKETIEGWSYPSKYFKYGGQEKSGTYLYLEHLKDTLAIEVKPCIQKFVELVNVYDNWILDSPDRPLSEDLNRLFSKVQNYSIKEKSYEKYKFFIDLMLKKFEYPTFSFTAWELEKIEAVKQAEEKAYQGVIHSKIHTRKDSYGRNFSIIEASSKVSYICNRMLEQFKGLSYIICLNSYTPDTPKISLRSRKEINLLDDYEGTEGHPNSCGLKNDGTLSKNHFVGYDFWDEILKDAQWVLPKKGCLHG